MSANQVNTFARPDDPFGNVNNPIPSMPPVDPRLWGQAVNVGTATILANAPCVPCGWDSTQKRIKVKRPESDSPPIVLYNSSSDADTDETLEFYPGTGRVMRAAYDEAPDDEDDPLANDYGAGEDADTLIKGNTGFKLIADLAGGVGLFLPFKSAGGIIDISLLAIDSSQKKYIDDSNNTGTPSADGQAEYNYNLELDSYINLDADVTIGTKSALLPSFLEAGSIGGMPPSSAKYEYKIYYSDTAWNLAGITTWAGRPLGTLLGTFNTLEQDCVSPDSKAIAHRVSTSGETIRGLRFVLSSTGAVQTGDWTSLGYCDNFISWT